MGLKKADLKDMMYDIFEIDSYASKMGSDEEIVTLSFSLKNRASADDLMKFLETGYDFVLDADVTPGEQSDGTYKVFVEIERDKESAENIDEMLAGIKNLTDHESLRFRYYKNWRSEDATLEELQKNIPIDPENYGITVNETNLNNYKNFFNRSFVETIDLLDNVLTIKKSFADPLSFRFLDFGPTQETLDSINESFNANDFAEIIFLSKYIGDYNITKYGNKLALENSGNTLVVERIL